MAVIETSRPLPDLEAALYWVEVVLYYIEQYGRVSKQKEATDFVLNVVQ